MINNQKVLAVIPARGGSKGVPRKNIKLLCGKPLVAWSIEAGKNSRYVDKIIVSTEDIEIAEISKKYSAEVPFFRPAELATDTALPAEALLHALNYLEKKGEYYDYIVQLDPTSPLRTAEDIDRALEMLLNNPAANSIVGMAKPESAHPDFIVSLSATGIIKPLGSGLGIGTNAPAKMRQELGELYFPEGTVYISDVPTFKIKKSFYHESTMAYPVERYKQFEIDEEMDFVVVEALMKSKFHRREALPKWVSTTGVDLWERAKRIIPGGNQLLSKRPETFLPNLWPTYYQKAKGVEVWDLDNNKLIDMSYSGIGACILGYADDDVNNAVKQAIDNGSMCTLNSYEEVELTELLLKLHPWAGMARYARSGGEAMSIAVRIARAFTGKEKVAFCGYHGWHDWYLAANLADDKNLDGHLLPGLDPKGVPRSLKGTALPFEYNNLEKLKEIVKTNEVGVIVLETIKHKEPTTEFLAGVRKIATEIGAVLILDEITVGWRINLGGAYEKYGLQPDMVVYAKAISNGYPMAAIIGKREVMDAAQGSFISSTSWTERIGFVAALATIRKMMQNNVAGHLTHIGKLISKGWLALAEKHSLDIEVVGIPPLTTFNFKYAGSQALHTLFNQEMLRCGYLTTKSVYVCYAHTEQIVENYLKAVDEVFAIIQSALENNEVHSKLLGPVAYSGFKRLN